MFTKRIALGASVNAYRRFWREQHETFDKFYYGFVDAPFSREDDFLPGRAASHPLRYNNEQTRQKAVINSTHLGLQGVNQRSRYQLWCRLG